MNFGLAEGIKSLQRVFFSDKIFYPFNLKLEMFLVLSGL